MIVRGKRPDRGFTLLDNTFLRDRRLSYRSRGILAAILSYPDDWQTDYKRVAREGKEGESAVRTALAELREAGYIIHIRRQVERGRWRTDVAVYDTPERAAEALAQAREAEESGRVLETRSSDGRSPEGQHLYEDGHEDSYEDDLTCAPAPRGPADDTQTTDDDDPADWRDLDYKLWCSLLGDPPHLLQSGKRYALRACYDAIRRSTNQGARKKWPGRYFEAMDDIEREDWLADRWSLTLP